MEYSNKEKREIIEAWFTSNYHQLRTNVFKICGGRDDIVEKWGKDLLPYFIEGFLKRDIKDQWSIFTDNKFENYCTRGMALALKSKTSTFYHQYRKKGMAFRELIPEFNYQVYNEDNSTKQDEKIKIVQDAIEELDFYDRYLIGKYYIESINLSELAEITGINTATISRDIKLALRKLEKILIEKDIEL
jgi:RNA polymerase sigma factor (sigma-70 family)